MRPSDEPVAPSKKPTRTRERKPRGRGLRTRTGCITCRRRHLKCNEVKPVCGPCVRSNQACIYADPTAPKPSTSSESSSVSNSTTKSSATSISTNTAPPSVSTPPEINYSRKSSDEPAELAFRSHWNQNHGYHGIPAQSDHPTHYPQPVVWSSRPGDLSPPTAPVHYPPTTNIDHDAITRLSTKWAPLSEGFEASGLTGPPSMHSDEACLPEEYKYNTMRHTSAYSNDGSDDYNHPITRPIPHSVTDTDAALAQWFGHLCPDDNTKYMSLKLDPDHTTPRLNAGRSPTHSASDSHQAQSFAGSYQNSIPVDRVSPVTNLEKVHTVRARPSNPASVPWRLQRDISLTADEITVLDHFVHILAPRIDIFDPEHLMSSYVPHLALRNAGLMNAILALGVRQLAGSPIKEHKKQYSPTDALPYYNETLRYLQCAMQYESYNRSDELLATCLIIASYEMLIGSEKDWERHIQGFNYLQGAQLIHGEAEGLRRCVWWAWFWQDVWTAFRDKRKPIMRWRPTKDYTDMTPYEIAQRSMSFMAHAVSFCSQEEIARGEADVRFRVAKANHLLSLLDHWESSLPIEFNPLPVPTEPGSVFKKIRYYPPVYGGAVQITCAARILILAHLPQSHASDNSMQRQNASLQKTIQTIGGIAAATTDHSVLVASTPSLFIAGLFTQEPRQRAEIIRLLEGHRESLGWPEKPLTDELQMIWNGLTDGSFGTR